MTYILENAWRGFNVRDTETGLILYFQSDWEYPMLAENFGAHILCDCGETDGTVDCDHTTASAMIEAAGDWLFDNDGAETDSCFGDYPTDMWSVG